MVLSKLRSEPDEMIELEQSEGTEQRVRGRLRYQKEAFKN
jgi:hypothetical protein